MFILIVASILIVYAFNDYTIISLSSDIDSASASHRDSDSASLRDSDSASDTESVSDTTNNFEYSNSVVRNDYRGGGEFALIENRNNVTPVTYRYNRYNRYKN